MNVDLSDPASPPRDPSRESGDELPALLARWQRPIYNFAWRYLHNAADAEDIAIETFARWHENRHALRPGANVSSWLFSTAANLCRNRQRWRRRHPEDTDELFESIPTGDASPDRAAQNDELRLALRAAIDELPSDQKTALLLHEFEHASCREIAAVVGCTERGVETRLYRARQRLRKSLRHLVPEV
ncbi:MAG TPA: sigma-70 family RNA polymerase sigma factor [Opitutaceae bacterium]